MFKGMISALALGVVLTATASSSVESVIADAVAANKQAKALGHEWNVTGQAIKAAQAALKAGNEAEAMELAAQAKYMAEASVYQANDEKEAWKLRVPR